MSEIQKLTKDDTANKRKNKVYVTNVYTKKKKTLEAKPPTTTIKPKRTKKTK